MSVDLGTYAVPVLLAYGGSLFLLVGIVGLSVWQARRSSAELEETERSRDG